MALSPLAAPAPSVPTLLDPSTKGPAKHSQRPSKGPLRVRATATTAHGLAYDSPQPPPSQRAPRSAPSQPTWSPLTQLAHRPGAAGRGGEAGAGVRSSRCHAAAARRRAGGHAGGRVTQDVRLDRVGGALVGARQSGNCPLPSYVSVYLGSPVLSIGGRALIFSLLYYSQA